MLRLVTSIETRVVSFATFVFSIKFKKSVVPFEVRTSLGQIRANIYLNDVWVVT